MPYRKAEAFTRKLRECCNRLDAIDHAVRQDVGITSAMRVVLETLHEGGAQTVPQIARAKDVSRQHIQALVDRLFANQLISMRQNPRDRRSPLLALSEPGERIVERMREREVRLLSEMSRVLGEDDMDVALTTLDALRAYLERKNAENNHQRR